MRIGVLSDIHGNQYALKEVLQTAKRLRIEKLLVLGDIVGYYYHPDTVLEMLSSWDYTFIRGNHEQFLKEIISGSRQEPELRKKYGSGHRKAIEQLSNEQLGFLTDAPESTTLTAGGIKVMLCHGAPWQTDYYLYPDTPKDVLDRCSIAGIDFVFVGHSHYPFSYKTPESMLVNVGSVGQSRKVGGLASWCLLDTETKGIELISTPYDVTPLLKEVTLTDPELPYMKDILIRKA